MPAMLEASHKQSRRYEPAKELRYGKESYR